MTEDRPTTPAPAPRRLPVDDAVIARALIRWAQATYPGRKFTVVYDQPALAPTSEEGKS